MPLSHIQHFLVAADDIDATRDWYARVLGIKPGPHPDFGFPVHWMYLGETYIVHIGPSAKAAGEIQKKYLGRTSRDAGTGTGALDHIAFRATGLRAMLEQLKREEIHFAQRRANGQALLSMLPQLGAGGCCPSPRNDRLASAITAAAIASVACTMSGATMFGKMWRSAILR